MVPLVFTILIAGFGILTAASGLIAAWEHYKFQNTICKIEKQTPVENTSTEHHNLYCPDVLISYNVKNQIYQKTIQLNCTSNKDNQMSNFVKFSEFECAYNKRDISELKTHGIASLSYLWLLLIPISIFLVIYSIFCYFTGLIFRR